MESGWSQPRPHQLADEPAPDPAIDDAIDLAVDRVREAEEDLLEAPLGTEESVERAERVTRRAEDLDELAAEGVLQSRREDATEDDLA